MTRNWHWVQEEKQENRLERYEGGERLMFTVQIMKREFETSLGSVCMEEVFEEGGKRDALKCG